VNIRDGRSNWSRGEASTTVSRNKVVIGIPSLWLPLSRGIGKFGVRLATRRGRGNPKEKIPEL
jgi:hypothetical protein